MLLQTKKLCKRFGNMYALRDIDFGIREAEVHGLVGENGAGKSTLIKILAGVYTANSGDIIWRSQKVKIENPQHSRQLGIHVIHQDRQLIPSFSGIENIYLGLEYETKFGFKVDYRAMRKNIEKVMEELDISVPLNLPASKLTPPERTLIEIIRAMMTQCKLLILDEPTAALTDKEANALFALIERLKKRGTSVLYVSHRMDEIFRLTDRITVLKNGTFVDTVNTEDVNADQIIKLMSGDVVSGNQDVRESFGGNVLEVHDIKSQDNIIKSGNFVVRSGEILGIFGLGGSGRTEMLECIYGHRKSTGEVKLNGKAYNHRNERTSIDRGMVLICEDRRNKALVTNLTVKKNTLLTTLDQYVTLGILNSKKEELDTNQMIDRLDIKTEGSHQVVSELSGGNQQKVVFAKALMSKPNVILCDEPTQAVDVKTRIEIHKLLRESADNGSGIVFVSSDLKEILEVSDNVLVMANGRTKELFANKGLTSEQILASCYAKESE